MHFFLKITMGTVAQRYDWLLENTPADIQEKALSILNDVTQDLQQSPEKKLAKAVDSILEFISATFPDVDWDALFRSDTAANFLRHSRGNMVKELSELMQKHRLRKTPGIKAGAKPQGINLKQSGYILLLVIAAVISIMYRIRTPRAPGQTAWADPVETYLKLNDLKQFVANIVVLAVYGMLVSVNPTGRLGIAVTALSIFAVMARLGVLVLAIGDDISHTNWSQLSEEETSQFNQAVILFSFAFFGFIAAPWPVMEQIPFLSLTSGESPQSESSGEVELTGAEGKEEEPDDFKIETLREIRTLENKVKDNQRNIDLFNRRIGRLDLVTVYGQRKQTEYQGQIDALEEDNIANLKEIDRLNLKLDTPPETEDNPRKSPRQRRKRNAAAARYTDTEIQSVLKETGGDPVAAAKLLGLK
jgi:hypothetical protein